MRTNILQIPSLRKETTLLLHQHAGAALESDRREGFRIIATSRANTMWP
jgi:hypothetical protein